MSSQAKPFYIYIFSLIPHFLLGGDFPPSVVILHMFPCIEHRYLPLLGTSLFSPWHSYTPYFVTMKHFYSFSRFSKYLKKSQKIKKPKSWIGKDVIFGSCWVVSPSNRALYMTSIGWVIVWLRSCTHLSEFYLHRLVKLPVPMEPLLMPSVS